MIPSRPQLMGDFGMATSSHWISSAVAMGMLESGGNAFDAVVAGVFALQVIEPQQSGPGGDIVAMFARAGDDVPTVLCGQGVAPARAVPSAFAALGLDLIPGSGLLPASVPGATPALLTLLRDHGTFSLRQVLEPTIELAAGGYPLGEQAIVTIRSMAEVFEKYWPASYSTYLPGGSIPRAGDRFVNRQLAETYRRLLAEAEAAGADRDSQLDAALLTWGHGFIAEAVHEFSAETHRDANGTEHRGLISADDLASWAPSYESALGVESGGYTVYKAGPWSQGPVMLQQLALLEGTGFDPVDPASVHAVIEAAKLAFADREAWYGDSGDTPIEALLSAGYADERRKLITESASHEFRPGSPSGRTPLMPDLDRLDPANSTHAAFAEPNLALSNAAFAEPNLAAPGPKPGATAGDTVSINVIDRFGNMISALPSGGWLQSSPIIPKLGFALGTRMQMMWLEQGLPSSLVPGKRPRTTLSPTIAFRDGAPAMVLGSPGGDQQNQWQMAFLLAVLHGERNLQRAIEYPKFHIRHFPASFYPRRQTLGQVLVEESFGADVIADLKARGHDVTVSPAWSLGRIFAAQRDRETGFLTAGADPRGGLGYALGR